VVLYGPGEHYNSLADALVNIKDVLTLGSKLMSSNEIPKIDTLSELLEVFGEV
jgi:hypothetical protein